MANMNEITSALGNAYEVMEITASVLANTLTLYGITHDDKDYKRALKVQSRLERRQEKLEIAFHDLFIAQGIENGKACEMAKCAADSATRTLLHRAYSEITIA